MSNEFKEGDVVVALKNSPMGNYAAGDMGTVIGGVPDEPKVRFASWEGWPMNGNVRLATHLEQASHLYSQASAKSVKAQQAYEQAEQDAEQAENERSEAWGVLEAAKKAAKEKDARIIKPHDIQPGALFKFGKDYRVIAWSGEGFVIQCPPDLGFASGTSFKPAQELADYMNAVGYVKLNKTLKDILTNV